MPHTRRHTPCTHAPHPQAHPCTHCPWLPRCMGTRQPRCQPPIPPREAPRLSRVTRHSSGVTVSQPARGGAYTPATPGKCRVGTSGGTREPTASGRDPAGSYPHLSLMSGRDSHSCEDGEKKGSPPHADLIPAGPSHKQSFLGLQEPRWDIKRKCECVINCPPHRGWRANHALDRPLGSAPTATQATTAQANSRVSYTGVGGPESGSPPRVCPGRQPLSLRSRGCKDTGSSGRVCGLSLWELVSPTQPPGIHTVGSWRQHRGHRMAPLAAGPCGWLGADASAQGAPTPKPRKPQLSPGGWGRGTGSRGAAFPLRAAAHSGASGLRAPEPCHPAGPVVPTQVPLRHTQALTLSLALPQQAALSEQVHNRSARARRCPPRTCPQALWPEYGQGGDTQTPQYLSRLSAPPSTPLLNARALPWRQRLGPAL